MNIEENTIKQRRSLYFHIYSISMSGAEVTRQFTIKYGYAPEKIIITGGGILAGPIKEKRDEIGPCG